MSNVKLTRKGNSLVITVDLTAASVPSKSGKTLLVASTRGNVPVDGPGAFKVGLNVYQPVQ